MFFLLLMVLLDFRLYVFHVKAQQTRRGYSRQDTHHRSQDQHKTDHHTLGNSITEGSDYDVSWSKMDVKWWVISDQSVQSLAKSTECHHSTLTLRAQASFYHH